MKKNLFFTIAICFVLLGTNVNGAVVLDNPRDLIGTGNSQFASLSLGDNLMERIDGNDYIVDKGIGEYYIFLAKALDSGGIIFGGYLSTDNPYSDSGYSGYEGYCNGGIDRNTFLTGDSIDVALCLFDPDGGRFGLLSSNGALVFDDNLTAWSSGIPAGFGGKIEYNGVMDGLVKDFVFPANSSEMLQFRHIVLTDASTVPEPGAILLCCFGAVILRRKINCFNKK